MSTENENKGGMFPSVSRKINGRKWILGVALLVGLLLVLVAVSVYLNWRNKSDEFSYTPVCNSEIIKRANGPINSNNITEMKTLYDEIVKKPKHDGDPNCLYIEIRYKFMTGRSGEAKTLLDHLEKVFPSTPGYDLSFSPDAQTIQELKQTLAVFEKQAAENKSVQDENDALDEAYYKQMEKQP